MSNPDDIVAKLSGKLRPDAIRSNLVRAGLFLAAWEMLKSQITEQVRLFYGATVKGSWGNYSIVPDDENPISRQRYAEKVLALDTGKEKGKIFRASLRWLVESAALTEAEAARVCEIERHRNEVAHELMKVVVDPNHQGVDIAMIHEMRELIRGLGVFWGRIEVEVNPDVVGQDIADAEIRSGLSIFMDYLVDAAPTAE